MKKLLLYTFCLLLLLSSCSGNQEPASGLLWKITTPNGKKAFLFGTMHVYPEDQVSISDDVMAALKTCSVLATERNVRDAEDQRLFEEQNKHKTGARTYQVIEKHYGSGLKSMERELMRVADRHRIPVTGLEKAQELLGLLSRIQVPLEENLSDVQIIAKHKQVISLYKSANIDSLADRVLDQELGTEIRRLMIDQRNLNWLDDIENLIQYERAFIAVGMGHLGGEKGLINLLRQKGYTVERTEN